MKSEAKFYIEYETNHNYYIKEFSSKEDADKFSRYLDKLHCHWCWYGSIVPAAKFY